MTVLQYYILYVRTAVLHTVSTYCSTTYCMYVLQYYILYVRTVILLYPVLQYYILYPVLILSYCIVGHILQYTTQCTAILHTVSRAHIVLHRKILYGILYCILHSTVLQRTTEY